MEYWNCRPRWLASWSFEARRIPWAKHTNSATSFALPLKASLWTFELSLSPSLGAMIGVVGGCRDKGVVERAICRCGCWIVYIEGPEAWVHRCGALLDADLAGFALVLALKKFRCGALPCRAPRRSRFRSPSRAPGCGKTLSIRTQLGSQYAGKHRRHPLFGTYYKLFICHEYSKSSANSLIPGHRGPM